MLTCCLTSPLGGLCNDNAVWEPIFLVNDIPDNASELVILAEKSCPPQLLFKAKAEVGNWVVAVFKGQWHPGRDNGSCNTDKSATISYELGSKKNQLFQWPKTGKLQDEDTACNCLLMSLEDRRVHVQRIFEI